MSILVKDMEMPRENELIIINSNGDVEKVKCDGTSWLCDSKATELSPHGRLIDANAMIASIKKQSGFLKNMGGDLAVVAEILEKGILQEIENAPTIIPKEEE